MLRRSLWKLAPKKVSLGEEKYGQAALEYVYEQNSPNDPKKNAADIRTERLMAAQMDRYCKQSDRVFEQRMERLVTRMNEAMAAVPAELLTEASLLCSEQPPLSYQRPGLTPPVPKYTPAFGSDVPQLRAPQTEWPTLERPTDDVEDEPNWPFLDAEMLGEVNRTAQAELEEAHNATRSTMPYTGVEGEEWEAGMALNKKAVARQQLILELTADPTFQEQYDSDEAFRAEELEKRGILPLEMEDDSDIASMPIHYAQEVKHGPTYA